ncbi:MAG: ECF-type sigma factor [Planctomycetota bacterium]
MDPAAKAERLEEILRTLRPKAADPALLNELFELALPDLERIAEALLRLRVAGAPVQATSLVNRAALKVLSLAKCDWNNYAHFLGYAARAMRTLLCDAARRRRAKKRSGPEVPFEAALLQAYDDKGIDFLVLDDLLVQLKATDARLAQILELRLVVECSKQDIARMLGTSLYEVDKRLAFGEAWLTAQMQTEAT